MEANHRRSWLARMVERGPPEVLEAARRPAGGLALHGGLGQFGGDLGFQAGIAGQAEQDAHAGQRARSWATVLSAKRSMKRGLGSPFVHRVATLVGQRVFGIALGYEDLSDHDHLRHDPVLAVLAGKLAARRSDCAPLAGKSTLNRLEPSRPEPIRYHKIAHHPAAIERLFVRCKAADSSSCRNSRGRTSPPDGRGPDRRWRRDRG
jgi:hypothetical protein